MKLNRFSSKNKIEEGTVINSKTFLDIKVKSFCNEKIFDKYSDSSFIFILNNGKVIVYERGCKNTYTNLREYVNLFGSRFFKNPILNTDFGENLKDFYEKQTGYSIKEIYKYEFD